MQNELNKQFIEEIASLYTFYYEAQLGISLAEELANETESKYFVSANNELKAALHHFMRAFESFKKNPTEDIWRVELIKAGEEHLKRAIFDAYTYIIDSLIVAQEGFLAPFDANDIIPVIPTYYSDILPKTFKFREQLAKARIDRSLDSLIELKKILLEGVFINHQIVLSSGGKLAQTKRRNKFKVVKGYVIGGIIGIGASLIAAFIWEFPKPKPTPISPQQLESPQNKK